MSVVSAANGANACSAGGVVVITGASMGIGRALALAWAARKKTVVLSARSESALEEVRREVEKAGGRGIVVAGDVTDEEYRGRLIRKAEESGGVEVLVNNAGRGFYARALDVDLDELRSLFELNVFAPLRLVQLAAASLERSKGTVVMLSSVAGVLAAPKYAAYSATKFALEAISMSMRAELAPKGIRVVVIRPGPVHTPFRANAARAKGMVGYDKPADNAQSVEDVALLTLRAVDRKKDVVETSASAKLIELATRLAPWAVRATLKRMPSH